MAAFLPQLEDFYVRGLVALRTPEQQQLAQELMTDTGLSRKQIKVFLFLINLFIEAILSGYNLLVSLPATAAANVTNETNIYC